MANKFLISGYWVDDGSSFDDLIVKDTHDYEEDEDDEIFFFGLGERDIKEAIEHQFFIGNSYRNQEHLEPVENELVITSYSVME